MTVSPFPVLRQPIILLGMHRSGTSLVSRALDVLGLFPGHSIQDDHESTYFLEANDLLMRRIGASWDNPGPTRAFLENPQALDLTTRCLAGGLKSFRIRTYLGLLRFARVRSLGRLDTPWGWKDPRTVFTLPAWLQLFPGAKLVYIVRNGIDVAASLRVREVAELERRQKQLPRKARKWKRHSLLERAGFKGSGRCLTLAGGFSLWEEYVAEAERLLATLPNERVVVNYERFLADPAAELPALSAFCGLTATDGQLAQVIGGINPGRGGAFLADPELKTFYEQVRSSQWMMRYGYGELA